MTQALDAVDADTYQTLPGGVIRVRRPKPNMGGKCVVLASKGTFILEEGPGTLITMACTHAGSGSLIAADGLPDARGYLSTFSPDPDRTDQDFSAPGLELARMLSVVMGSWMLNAGFNHGLTIKVVGGIDGVSPFISVVWMPYAAR